jgi:HlyD family secretion protein
MFKRLSILLCVFLLVCCHSKEQKKDPVVVTVYPSSTMQHLYYNGVVKPLQEEAIISPTDGVISKVNFHYGDFVRKGDLLFTIHSSEMESQFREAISNYLRIKQAYLNSEKSMSGTEMLFKEKIISEQEYLNERSQYQNNLLSFVEASTKLKQYLSYLPSFHQQILTTPILKLEDAQKLLDENVEDLAIYAKSPGIVLFPEEKNGNSAKLLQLGSNIKKEDILLVIGDLSGLSITANVAEKDINRLIPNLKVTLTFASDLELELHGKIISVAKQAINLEGVNLVTFPVIVHVENLKPQQLKKIRVGMNAKLDILLEEPPAIKVPISAVHGKDNKSWLTVINEKSGKPTEVEVKTGTTTLTDIYILKGLQAGDKVLIDD